MLIREMTVLDVPAVADIEKECFSLPWSQQSIRDSVEREDTLFLVCEETIGEVSNDLTVKKVIVGYIGMYLSFEEGDITNVAVSQQYRTKGYGEALVKKVKALAKERQLATILLEVRISNAPAISLYKKMGFEEIGFRKKFYEYPIEDALIMSCML